MGEFSKKPDPPGKAGRGGGGLSAQVQSLTTPNQSLDPSKEMVMVDYGGVQTPIIRGNMTQEDWDRVKAQSLSSQPAATNAAELAAADAANGGVPVVNFPPQASYVGQDVGHAPLAPATAPAPSPVIAKTEVTPESTSVPAQTTAPQRAAGQPDASQVSRGDALQSSITDTANAHLLALDKQFEIDQKANADKERLLREQALSENRLNLEFKEQQKVYNDEIDRAQRGYAALTDEMHQLSRQSVDPNRFWTNKDAGQKVAATIAGALFGFTGQGMQWLQRLDSLVEQDIQAQAADLSRRGGLLKDTMGAQTNLVSMAQAKGLSGRQAYEAAKAGLKQHIATQMEANAAGFANEGLQSRYLQQAAAVRESGLRDLKKVDEETQMFALKKRQMVAELHKTNAEAAKLGAEARAGKSERVSEPTTLKLAEYQKGVDNLLRIKAIAMSEQPGFDTRLVSQLEAKLPGISKTLSLSKAQKEAAIKSLAVDYRKFKTKEATNEGDKKDVEEWRPSVGSSDFTAINNFLESDLKNYNTDKRFLSARGSDVSKFPELTGTDIADSFVLSPAGKDKSVTPKGPGPSSEAYVVPDNYGP